RQRKKVNQGDVEAIGTSLPSATVATFSNRPISYSFGSSMTPDLADAELAIHIELVDTARRLDSRMRAAVTPARRGRGGPTQSASTKPSASKHVSMTWIHADAVSRCNPRDGERSNGGIRHRLARRAADRPSRGHPSR